MLVAKLTHLCRRPLPQPSICTKTYKLPDSNIVLSLNCRCTPPQNSWLRASRYIRSARVTITSLICVLGQIKSGNILYFYYFIYFARYKSLLKTEMNKQGYSLPTNQILLTMRKPTSFSHLKKLS